MHALYTPLLTFNIPTTVKHSYSEHIYNELMLTVKGMSFLVTYVVNLTDITNYSNKFNEAKLPVPSTSS